MGKTLALTCLIVLVSLAPQAGISLLPTGSVAAAALDEFGVEQIYPTLTDTTSWNSVHWNNGNPRVLTSAHERDPDDPTQWSMMRGRGELDFKGDERMFMGGEQPRLYLSDVPNKFWKNVEATVYYKRIKDDSTNWGGIVIGTRSGPEGHGSDPCSATTYYARIRHDGKMDFQKELMHPKSQVRESGPIWGGGPLPKNQWIGMKFVVYNINGDTNVKLELYRDLAEGDNGGTWEKLGEYTDNGGWDPEHDCAYEPDHIITEGGGVVFIRNTGVKEARYKWFTVREIDASSGDQAPTVSITSPADGANVSGTIDVTADASDDNGVAQVEFFVDGISIGVDTIAPYAVSWDTTTAADGIHTVGATATDTIGQTDSDSISVTVDNTPPTVSITSPAEGAIVSGTIDVTADASDDNGVTQVEFFADGASIGVDTTASYAVSWDTTTAANGSHTLTATATDVADNATTSDPVTVTVDNPVATTMHVGDLDGASTKLDQGAWSAQVTITVHNASEGLLEAALVSGHFTQNGDTIARTCTTGIDGTCLVDSEQFLHNRGSATFTVDNVTDTLAYQPLDNHDPDGDSTGTIIQLSK